MEEKRSSGRSKRIRTAEEEGWDCSVCTYRNSPEAFKCDMCDVRKGTSTRKPRINPQLVTQQLAQQFAPPPPPKKDKKELGGRKKEHGVNGLKKLPRLKNIDRSSATHMEVTVGAVTVIITDYKPKERNLSSETNNNSNNNNKNKFGNSDGNSTSNNSSDAEDSNDSVDTIEYDQEDIAEEA
ncbi:YY1-associated factor 2 [Lingula anatina]|uniref:YY1-associated factor 2 n=1 Tax=Lingula anatina TaxID=7574 RepID=A0A1S3INV8_LINAN|nr:YY1-associated factor 2 [Lingula anatina]|eukprot:XP_013399930.1 YY1-associated factor 2 [Lingula anatina]